MSCKSGNNGAFLRRNPISGRVVVVAPDLASRDALHRHMEKAGINCALPIERYELLHRYLNMDPTDFPVAERLVDTTLSLPIHPGLSETEIEQVAEALKRYQL